MRVERHTPCFRYGLLCEPLSLRGNPEELEKYIGLEKRQISSMFKRFFVKFNRGRVARGPSKIPEFRVGAQQIIQVFEGVAQKRVQTSPPLPIYIAQP